MEIKPRIRELRQARGLKLKELAEMIGISPPHLSEVERGKKNLNNHLLARLADALNVQPSDLIASNPEPGIDELLSVARSLSEDDRQRLKEFAEFLLLSERKAP